MQELLPPARMRTAAPSGPVSGLSPASSGVRAAAGDACSFTHNITTEDVRKMQVGCTVSSRPELAQTVAEDAFDHTAMIREELPGFEDLPTREAFWSAVRASPRAARESARDAGVAVADVDWNGRGTGIVTRVIGLLERLGGPGAED